eukprot:1014875-Pleurochrysis_carterae.AAC.2
MEPAPKVAPETSRCACVLRDTEGRRAKPTTVMVAKKAKTRGVGWTGGEGRGREKQQGRWTEGGIGGELMGKLSEEAHGDSDRREGSRGRQRENAGSVNSADSSARSHVRRRFGTLLLTPATITSIRPRVSLVKAAAPGEYRAYLPVMPGPARFRLKVSPGIYVPEGKRKPHINEAKHGADIESAHRYLERKEWFRKSHDASSRSHLRLHFPHSMAAACCCEGQK